MEIANVIVNLGGDAGNQVPKDSVTPAEIAILRAIHGEDGVVDIEPAGEIDRPQARERERLTFIYGHARGGDDSGQPIMKQLFPGIGARLPEKLSELDVPAHFMKTSSKSPSKAAAKAEADEQKRVEKEAEAEHKANVAASKEIQKDVAKGKKGKGERSPRSSATGTGLHGEEDGADPRPPIGKGGAGSLGIWGGVDGQGTPATLEEPKYVPPEPEDDADGVKDMPDEHSNARKGGPKHGRDVLK